MRYVLTTLFAFALGLNFVATSWADEAADALVAKAIKAHGGKDKLAAQKYVHLRTKGELELPGVGTTPFTQETWTHESGKLKDVMTLDVAGMAINLIVVYNGEKVWANANGMTMELDQELIGNEMKEAGNLARLLRLDFLGDKDVATSLVGDAMVLGRPAKGLRIARKGYKDVTLYVDDESGLVTKIVRQALDSTTGQEVTEERIIKEFKEVDGLKTPKKLLLNRDGQKFLEMEILEFKLLDKIDDAEFSMP